MVSEEITIRSKTGLHARPASQLVSLVKKFKSEVTLVHQNKKAKGTSIISILALGLRFESELEVFIDGEDETDALKAITGFFNELED